MANKYLFVCETRVENCEPILAGTSPFANDPPKNTSSQRGVHSGRASFTGLLLVDPVPGDDACIVSPSAPAPDVSWRN